MIVYHNRLRSGRSSKNNKICFFFLNKILKNIMKRNQQESKIVLGIYNGIVNVLD